MSSAPLPDWVFDGRDGVHAAEGSYSPSRNAKLPRSSLPVYQRQRFPDPLLGEKFAPGETVFENDGLRMWHDGDGIAVVSFKTKMNTVSDQVLDGLQECEPRREGLPGPGDLAAEGTLLRRCRPGRCPGPAAGRQGRPVRRNGRQLPAHQPAHQVLAGAGGGCVRGLALGGGCEFQMHSAKTVAFLESYIGLVEAGVGLLPAGGGLKELAVRASQAAARAATCSPN
jgi:3-hydroxyacyl-CoA dehydrogenase